MINKVVTKAAGLSWNHALKIIFVTYIISLLLTYIIYESEGNIARELLYVTIIYLMYFIILKIIVMVGESS